MADDIARQRRLHEIAVRMRQRRLGQTPPASRPPFWEEVRQQMVEPSRGMPPIGFPPMPFDLTLPEVVSNPASLLGIPAKVAAERGAEAAQQGAQQIGADFDSMVELIRQTDNPIAKLALSRAIPGIALTENPNLAGGAARMAAEMPVPLTLGARHLARVADAAGRGLARTPGAIARLPSRIGVTLQGRAPRALPPGQAQPPFPGQLQLPPGTGRIEGGTTIPDMETAAGGATRPAIRPLGPSLGQGQRMRIAHPEMPRGGFRVVRPDDVPQLERFMRGLEISAPLTKETLRVENFRTIAQSIAEALLEAGIRPDPDFGRLYTQLASGLEGGMLQIPRLNLILERKGLTLTDLGKMFRQDASDSARKLAAISVANRRLNGLAARTRDAKIAKQLRALQTAVGYTPMAMIKDMWYRSTDVWRGSLVSQLATTARNIDSNAMRQGFEAVSDTIGLAMERAMAQITGLPYEPQRQIFDPFRNLLEIARLPGHGQSLRKIVHGWIEELPVIENELFTTYMSDISTAAGRAGRRGARARRLQAPAPTRLGRAAQRTGQGIEAGVAAANTLNRMQEFGFRRLAFAAKIQERLQARGIRSPLEDIRMADVPNEDVAAAIDHALTLTFANRPRHAWQRSMINTITNSPLVLLAPFPRFMANAFRFLNEFNPHQMLKILKPTDRFALIRGKAGPEATRAAFTAFGKGSVGGALLLTSGALRKAGFGGPEWYQIAHGEPTAEGKQRYVDIRPLYPMSFYWWFTDMLERAGDGRLRNMTGQQATTYFIQGAATTTVRAGAANVLLDQFGDIAKEVAHKGVEFAEFAARTISWMVQSPRNRTDFASVREHALATTGEELFPLPQPSAASRQAPSIDEPRTDAIQRAVGSILGGFTVPLRNARDLIAEFSDQEALVRERRLNPLLAPTLENLPFATRLLPERRVATQAAPIRRAEPLHRQLTGATRLDLFPHQAELRRLGFRTGDVVGRRTGIPELNVLMESMMGPRIEAPLASLIASDDYQRLTDAERGVRLEDFLREMRRGLSLAAASALEELRPDLREQIQEFRQRSGRETRRQRLLRLEQRGR